MLLNVRPCLNDKQLKQVAAGRSQAQCNQQHHCNYAIHIFCKGKKIWVLVTALLTRLKQQHFTISKVAADWHELMKYRGALCGHPLPAMANNWNRGAAHRHTTAPISALGLHPVASELLLTSHPAEGRRLSWPEHAVG